MLYSVVRTGVEPMTSRYPARCATNCAIDMFRLLGQSHLCSRSGWVYLPSSLSVWIRLLTVNSYEWPQKCSSKQLHCFPLSPQLQMYIGRYSIGMLTNDDILGLKSAWTTFADVNFGNYECQTDWHIASTSPIMFFRHLRSSAYVLSHITRHRFVAYYATTFCRILHTREHEAFVFYRYKFILRW